MHRREFHRLIGSAAAALPFAPLSLGAEGRGRRWSFRAEVAECCSCDIPCPCNFGRPVDTCFGNRLIEIREGDFEGASLAGVTFLVTFQMGRWTRIYLDDRMSEAQLASFDRIFPVAFAGFDRLARSRTRVPLTIDRGTGTLRFSVPESAVEMRILPGLGGAPIVVEGLPSNAFHGYVQYESVQHRHSSSDGEWSYAGTNGFRSEMRASG